MFGFWKKTTLVGVTALIMCVASGKEAHAQRTMRGESLLTAGTHYPFSSPYWLGADLSYGQYLLSSYWKAGISATEYSHHPDSGADIGYLHAAAYGEWMYRIAGTRNRAFNLYGGGGVFLGYEAIDAFSLLPEEMKEDYPKGAFLYGVNASFEMEIFFSKKVALVIGGRLPMNFSSQFGWFHYQVGAGLRFNL